MSKQLTEEFQAKIKEWAAANAATEATTFDETRYVGIIDGAWWMAEQLVEAQERIKNIEKGIGDLIADMEGWRKACIDDMKRVEFNEDRSIGYDLNGRSKAEFDGILPRLKALSPNNKLKEDEDNCYSPI